MTTPGENADGLTPVPWLRLRWVRLTATGQPIATVECCCDSCRKAGAMLQSMPRAPDVLGPHGQTLFVMHRKDRVSIDAGHAMLRALRLSSRSGSRRVLAGCCNTPLFLSSAAAIG